MKSNLMMTAVVSAVVMAACAAPPTPAPKPTEAPKAEAPAGGKLVNSVGKEMPADAAPRVLPLAETYARMAGGGGPNQAGFGTALAADPMASAKLGEGIAAFCAGV